MIASRKFLKGWLLSLFASFFVATSWGWYHFSKHPKQLFAAKVGVFAIAVFFAYRFGKRAFVYLLKKFRRDAFWHTTLAAELDELFVVFSLALAIFFSRSEIASFVFLIIMSAILFWRTRKMLRSHGGSSAWLPVHTAFFAEALCLFVVNGIFQLAAYHYYILDSNIRFYNIVVFRAIAITLVQLVIFAGAALWYMRLRGAWRYALLVFWQILFALWLTFWAVNLGILYYSGLYVSPVALEHAEGASAVVASSNAGWIAFAVATIFSVHLCVTWFVFKRLKPHTQHAARVATGIVVIIALVSFATLQSLRNTPEGSVASAFYKYYTGSDAPVVLDPVILQKLKKFGFNFDPNQFFVNSRSSVFTTSTSYLPRQFKQKPPNIVIVLLESFSARLTDVYNNKFSGVTPNILDFSRDPHTTIFKNYYNASTPTITGTLSLLCSFLPPTGHNEIQNERKLQSHHLQCLPEVLKQKLGITYANYITAVDKEFAHKDGIFTSMGVDAIFGTAELAKTIPGKPLSWGYSDHQLFPELMRQMNEAKNQGNEPFLMMLATVDTHPPFNLAQDAVNYNDATQPVLNMFHTTDDAFGKFWQTFKNSDYYNNTILITVADHAIFPSALTKDLFPEDANKLTYYDPNLFMVYMPGSLLPKEVDTLSSGLDFAPTLLQILDINMPNSFEGHSILDDRSRYPNIVGMHELGLYINQVSVNGKRAVQYNVPSEISCPSNYTASSTPDLTECDYLQFFMWKRHMFEQGRFWKQN